MTAKRNKFKKEKKEFLRTLTKKKANAAYGYNIRSDIDESYNCVSKQWMKTEYDDRVKEWFPLKKGNLMVKIIDPDGLDGNG